jgi:hypothetical protein
MLSRVVECSCVLMLVIACDCVLFLVVAWGGVWLSVVAFCWVWLPEDWGCVRLRLVACGWVRVHVVVRDCVLRVVACDSMLCVVASCMKVVQTGKSYCQSELLFAAPNFCGSYLCILAEFDLTPFKACFLKTCIWKVKFLQSLMFLVKAELLSSSMTRLATSI